MSALRDAAQQALEALEFLADEWGFTHKANRPERWRAIEALRAALAQQAEPVEPVAICCNCLGTKRPHADDPEWKGRCDCEPPQLAEPVQEPVAWLHTDPDKPRVKFLEWREDEPGYRGRWIKTPLYAAPPQRKPLSDEQARAVVDAAAEDFHKRGWQGEFLEWSLHFTRAIERAHGIGGSNDSN